MCIRDSTDLARPFKLSDAAINALRTTGFRARGTATRCVQGPCTVDTTLYWRPTCLYASGSNSPACYTAFRDAAFTVPESASAPCSWHWGLVASDCSTTATMGTSHVSEHVFVGNYRSYVHAYDGRARSVKDVPTRAPLVHPATPAVPPVLGKLPASVHPPPSALMRQRTCVGTPPRSTVYTPSPVESPASSTARQLVYAGVHKPPRQSRPAAQARPHARQFRALVWKFASQPFIASPSQSP